ncbi:HEPN domain-containing protein [Gemmata sp. JC717]|uniref:HEPN domain-containing protein n=1 Tax=Gemmata algarum TaxID=2975278 RepID=UPI0021BA90EA|nr:HEPN domain-containing protein [Gemmata algarum]MDY3552393.1 HEPN domain-containing protein [Gemmata algarum]
MSTPIQTRADFQQLAEVRLVEANALLDLGHWDGAYYLTGYAVELALKACVIKLLMATDAFPDKDFSRECYTHDLSRLVKVAGLEADLTAALAASPGLMSRWRWVLIWSEHKRYHRVTESESRELYDAVASLTDGVLAWVKTRW